MILELHVADVVDDHKIKMDAMLEEQKDQKICHSYRGLVSLCRWINCYLGVIMIAFVVALKGFTQFQCMV